MTVRKLATALLVASALTLAGSAQGAQASPTLDARLSGGSSAGEAVVDTVTLAGSVMPSGRLSVSVYGPGDPTCSQFPETYDYVTVAGDVQHAFTTFVGDVGTFHYVASYEGDANNAAVSTACGDPSQTLTVTPAHSSLVTTASPSVAIGGELSDAARLTHVVMPSGTVTFSLYGPGDDACAGSPIATSTVPVRSDDARASSPPYKTTAPGTYHWIASYSGDVRNLPASGTCGDPGESVTVTDAAPPIATGLSLRASGAASVGEPIRATATLMAPGIPSGRITFRVYRPGDDRCRSGAVAASTRTVLGNGDYTSDPFTPDEPGTYRIIATFHGDDASTLATACDGPGAAVPVAPADRPRPVLERSVTLSRVDGSVLVRVPPAQAARRTAAASRIGFVEVHSPRNVPVGSTVDARSGTARITSATSRSSLQSGTFRGSRFVVRQRAGRAGEVELRLRTAGNAACRSHEAARAARRRRVRQGVLGELHAKVRGEFSTQGKHSSASAHGTEWVTIERCDGTLTRVVSHTVAVHDFRLHRTTLVHAGESYLARSGGNGR